MRLLAMMGLLLLSAPAMAARQAEPLELRLASGRIVTAELRMPEGASGPVPVVMLFGGFRGAASVLNAVPDDLPIATASFDYPFDPPRRFEFPQSLGHIPALARGIDKTFEGIALLTEQLRARADIDAQRITIVGVSLGAPFATVSASRLELPGLVVVHGFGELRRVIAQQFIRALEPDYGRWVRWPSWGLANALVWGYRLPAPERYARRLQPGQRALMVVAAGDELIPEAATETLWQGLRDSGAEAERIDRPGVHLRGIHDPRVAELLFLALGWMDRVDLY